MEINENGRETSAESELVFTQAFTLLTIHNSAFNKISAWIKQLFRAFSFCCHVWTVHYWPLSHCFPAGSAILKLLVSSPPPSPPPTAWLLNPTCSLAQRRASAGTPLFNTLNTQLQQSHFHKKICCSVDPQQKIFYIKTTFVCLLFKWFLVCVEINKNY